MTYQPTDDGVGPIRNGGLEAQSDTIRLKLNSTMLLERTSASE